MSFAPAIAPTARKAISQTIRAWHLRRRSESDLSSIAAEINPQVRGWIGYYGVFYRSELHFLAWRIDQHIVRWARHKFKRLRYSPARRLRSVRPALQPCVQVVETLLQLLPVGLPRHAVYPRSSLRAQRPIGRPQAIDVDVMQERGELRFPVLLCDSAHTIQRTRRALPGAVSGARFAGRVPLGQPPSLHRLRDRLRGVVRRARRHYGAVRLPTLVHLRRTASAFPERPALRATSRRHAHFADR
ncbi:MAG: hypothetical protein LC777_09370 [Actinobacteria bacterium]|nr:hypothetical protein [Actinomycetota bacterium]